MKRIISLTKVLYKNGKNDSGKLKNGTKVFLYVLLAAYLLFVFSSFWEMFITPLNSLGEARSFIPLILSIGVVFILGTSVSYVANILYFSNDIESILAFPFKPKEIFVSKLLTVYIYELLIVAMLLLPGFIAYGYLLNEGVIFYIYSFFILLLLPVIPIICIAGIYTVIMQFLKFAKYKNLFKVFTTIILLVMVIGFQLNMNLNMNDSGEYNGEYILEMCNNFSSKLPYFLDVAVNVFKAENMFSSVISLVWFIIINVVISFAVVQACNNLYIKGIKYNLNGTTPKIIKSQNRTYKSRNKYFSILDKEIKGLFRNTTFFIQCVLPVFIMPVIMIVMSVNTPDEINNIMIIESSTLEIIFGITIIQFFMIMNYVSVTAVSRDGIDEATYLKTQPLNFSKLIAVKTIPGIFLGIINLIISLVFISKFFVLDISEFVVLFVIGFLLNVIQNYLQIIIDLKHPKLYWEAEMAVVKQNINIFYSVLICFAFIVVISTLGEVFMNYDIIYFEVLTIALLLTVYFGIKLYLKKGAEKLYKNIK